MISSLRFGAGGKVLLSSGRDGRVVIWDTAKGKPLKEWEFPGPVWCARFGPDGEHIAVANGNGSIYVLSVSGIKAGDLKPSS